jgi:voltage-gated potassium channel
MGDHTVEDRSKTDPHVELSFAWEVFVLLLSILSIVNLVLGLLPIADTSKSVVYFIDGALTLVFLPDFLRRLAVASSKRAYFLHGGGILDLLGSIPLPGFRLLRLVRVTRAVRMLRRYGASGMAKRFGDTAAQGSILLVIFVAIVVLEFSSIFILGAERGAPDANITTASDALWWGYVTITTVGYGDLFPVTNEGRIVGVFLMTIGVGLFSTFAGFLANTFLAPRRAKRVAAASARPMSAEDLEQIRALVEEQERATTDLRARLAELEA